MSSSLQVRAHLLSAKRANQAQAVIKEIVSAAWTEWLYSDSVKECTAYVQPPHLLSQTTGGFHLCALVVSLNVQGSHVGPLTRPVNRLSGHSGHSEASVFRISG